MWIKQEKATAAANRFAGNPHRPTGLEAQIGE